MTNDIKKDILPNIHYILIRNEKHIYLLLRNY